MEKILTWTPAVAWPWLKKALQGAGPEPSRCPFLIAGNPNILATHGIPEGGSNTGPVEWKEGRERREKPDLFSVCFLKAAIRGRGGAMGIMAAYSELDGNPLCR